MVKEEESLAQAFFNGEREEKIKAAIHVTRLTLQQRNKLVDLGIINPLISMLMSRHHDSMEAALFALLSLSMKSQRNKIKIVRMDSLWALIEVLKHESESLVELGIVTVLTLSSCSANKSAIVNSGVVAVLVEFLNCNADDEVRFSNIQAMLDAIDILRNLSTNKEAIWLMVTAGFVFSLLQIIHNFEKSSKMVEKAMDLLEKIVMSSQIGIAQIGSVDGGILELVETVEDGSHQSREHAVGVLYLMCKSCREKYRELILREGAMPGLLQLCVDGTWRAKDLGRSLLLLLREKSDYGLKGKQLRNGILEQIMRKIETVGEKVDDTTVRLVEWMTTMMKVAV